MEIAKNIDEDVDIESSESTNEENDENYVIKTKICKRLSMELKLEEFHFDETGHWEPPKEPGLHNSNRIIPSYYQLDKNPSKIIDIDYYNIIKDDIRNFRPLNNYKLEYIKDLSPEFKNELFDIFNDCLKSIEQILDYS